MLSTSGRGFTNAVFGPVARLLVRAGVSPDVVTVIGTILTVGLALWLFSVGAFIVGPFAIAAVTLIDSIDGLMAREMNRATRWGAFLDSALDRLSDAAIFAGLAVWGIRQDEAWLIAGALVCLVLGNLVSYSRARAEGLGLTASGGIAERADRIAVVLVAVLAVGLSAPLWVLIGALLLLAAASVVTVGQRMTSVYRQTRVDIGRAP